MYVYMKQALLNEAGRMLLARAMCVEKEDNNGRMELLAVRSARPNHGCCVGITRRDRVYIIMAEGEEMGMKVWELRAQRHDDDDER